MFVLLVLFAYYCIFYGISYDIDKDLRPNYDIPRVLVKLGGIEKWQYFYLYLPPLD